MFFKGYRREDQSVGIRNHVLILPLSICASDVARIVSEQVKGTVTFHNHLGCSQTRLDTEYTMLTMAGLAANPNVYGVVAISLGCENCQMNRVVQKVKERTDKPLATFIIQECGGIETTIRLASQAAANMVEAAQRQKRQEIPISDLILGTECGGSDPTSGLISNILVGKVSDQVVKLGGTSILSETTEFIGAQHILKKRAVNEYVAQDIDNIIARYEESQKIVGDDIRMRNPSPGNKAGGITTLEEKSLGCIKKSGSAPIQKVYDYGQRIDHKGLVIMDTPGNDSISMTGMAAGGCQMILFTTGRGTPLGNPVVPVIKITGNQKTYDRMKESIDFNCSAALRDASKTGSMRDQLFQYMMDVCDGMQTSSEKYGTNESSIVRVGKYVKDGIVHKNYF